LHINTIDESMTPAKIRAMMKLGIPYPEGYDLQAVADMHKQAQTIADDLKANETQLLLGENGIQPNQEIIALIAYMQKLGADIEVAHSTNPTPKP
jgi:cytochrome c oxidase cbb3-type subunit I/II